jgi:hypothetical protein
MILTILMICSMAFIKSTKSILFPVYIWLNSANCSLQTFFKLSKSFYLKIFIPIHSRRHSSISYWCLLQGGLSGQTSSITVAQLLRLNSNPIITICYLIEISLHNLFELRLEEYLIDLINESVLEDPFDFMRPYFDQLNFISTSMMVNLKLILITLAMPWNTLEMSLKL